MPRGSAPGERRGGCQKGTPNKATAEIKEAARKYGEAAINRLAVLMMKAESEATQIAACKEILDRGYGKAQQYSINDTKHNVTDPFAEMIRNLNQPVFPKDARRDIG
jgi:hypothetical protein